MAWDKISRIKFEPYFTTKSPKKGTGLGLALVFAIVQEHKGHITVYSKPDQGTTVHVYLPIIDKPAVPHEQEKTGEASISGKETILFVDDEEALRDLADELLTGYGYTVKTLSNGIEAYEAFQQDQHQFDLVVTDMTMPGMTGLELSQKIMKLRPDQPIMLCTGHSESINRKTALSLGISEYFEKPFVTKELVKTIRTVLDTSKIQV